MNWLANFIFFKVLGWKLYGSISPNIKKCVVVVAPHTSWYDFFYGALIRKIIKVDVNYIAKKELFDSPFGWYFKWMGGSPLDRTPGQNKVEAIAKNFPLHDTFRLALSPEGTRKPVAAWKSGFYYISIIAKVPIILVALDYGKKEVKFSSPFLPSENIENDIKFIQEFYDGVEGKIPHYFNTSLKF